MEYKDGVLYSKEFKDTYFSRTSPFDESTHVFINLIDEIWDKKDRFIVAEAGFGVGLNFLNLAYKFNRSDKILHFVSIEKYPFSKKDLSEIWTKFAKFPNLSKKLIKKYPKFKDGLNRIHFSKNITLDIYFGDIKDALKEFEFKADVWFLDGFAPSKNPNMWDLEVMQGVANLSKFGTLLSTYSVAGSVRENLIKVGFNIEKRAGFGFKKEMLVARFEKESLVSDDIYFARPNNVNGKNVLVIGAGIAGLVSAYKLQKAGFNVIVAEKNDEVGLNGSGNLVGVLSPLITQKSVNLGKMHLKSFLFACKFYKKSSYAKFSGSKEFAFNENLVNRYKNSFFTLQNDAPYKSVFIKNAATIRPKAFCDFLSKKLKILLNFEFDSLEKVENCYKVTFKNDKIIIADIIVFCMGSHSEELFGLGISPRINFDDSVAISSVRGQVTWIKERVKSGFALSARGYICPAYKGVQLIGATYDRRLYFDSHRDMDDAKNVESVSEFLDDKKVEIMGSKVGYRSYSGDRFPIIGPLIDTSWFKDSYKGIHWGKKSEILPKFKDGLFINTAHGARGLSTAILGGELILDYVLNRPFCLEKTLKNEIHPARFLIRKLKKGLV